MNINTQFGGMATAALFFGTAIATGAASGIFPDTTSPDGQYAIAWGVEGEPINWQSSGSQPGEDWDKIENFIVDVKAKKTLRKTGTNHFPGRNHGGLDAIWWPDSKRVLVAESGKWSHWEIVVFQHSDPAQPDKSAPFSGPGLSIVDSLSASVRGYIAGTNPAYLLDPRFFVQHFEPIIVNGANQLIVGYHADHGKFGGPNASGHLIVNLGDGSGLEFSLVAALDDSAQADDRWAAAGMCALESTMATAKSSPLVKKSQKEWSEYIRASGEFHNSLASIPMKGALLEAVGVASAIDLRRRQLIDDYWAVEIMDTPEDADRLLNENYGKLKEYLDAAQLKKLRATQMLWIAYRDANGLVGPDTWHRADELRRLIEVLEWKLPKAEN